MSFDAFNLSPVLSTALKALHFKVPTPIQQKAIPVVLQGHDVMGLAQTGTGKTAAFVLPILEQLLHSESRKIQALVIAPTRELAEQINDDIRKLSKGTGIKSITIYGGVRASSQLRAIRDGAEIVVACPGRLLDFIRQRAINLSALKVLVLDEADQMFDMGFLPDIRKILQTLLFSATMPADIRRLAEDILENPVTLQAGGNAPAETVAHALYPIDQSQKTPLLLKLLEQTNTESVLVFTRTKQRAKRLGTALQQAGFKAASLQGNLSQSRRQEALRGFRDGSYQVLVATDIAARGIDVSGISHVINYDMPNTREAYTHRIGRTGRAAKTGDAFTLICKEDESLVRSIERMLGTTIERRRLKGFNYNTRVQHPLIPQPKNHCPERRFRSRPRYDGPRQRASSW